MENKKKEKESFKDKYNLALEKVEDLNHISYTYEKILDSCAVILRLNENLNITYVNKTFCKVFGYKEVDVINRPHCELVSKQISYEKLLNLFKIVKKNGVWRGHFKGITKEGKELDFISTIIALKNRKGEFLEYLIIRLDISEIIKSNDEKLRISLYDDLTKLKNNISLNSFIKSKKGVLLLIDIIDFKSINNLIGYDGGNYILQELSEVLMSHTRHDLFRVYGDLFALFYENENIEEVESKAADILYKIDSYKFEYKNLDIPVSLNIGISNIEPYLTTAEEALSNNKNSFKRISKFSVESKSDNNTIENFDMLIKIKKALEIDSIIPFYQPIVDINDNKILKYEALVRLIDKNRVILPYRFLEISKKSKLYPAITKLILRHAISFIKDTQANVSINISFEDMIDNDVLNYISLLLEMHADISEKITFEILESSEVTNYKYYFHFIEIIKRYNCKIAVDDFGMGFSNFKELLKIKPDFIKIDGSLIKNIHEDKHSRNIVETIVSFCKKSEISTVAEFIESKEIHNIVKTIGIDYGQGYYYGKPEQYALKR